MLMRKLAPAALVVVLAACSTPPPQVNVPTAEKDAPPDEQIDYSTLPDAVPRSEPITAAGNKSPYTVLGKTYHIVLNPKGFVQEGTASWYGKKFHGKRTSNGEIYDMHQMTAAHTQLPIPSYARVTNLENGRQVVVRVNDRGPFHSTRIIDLSYAAAMKLGYANQGTVRVRVEAIDTTPQAAAADQPVQHGSAYLQVGAFATAEGAHNLRKRVMPHTPYPVVIVEDRRNAATSYKVRVGPVDDPAIILDVQRILAESGKFDSFIVYE